MTESSSPSPPDDIQDVVVSKRQGVNIVWLIPIVAVIIGGILWIQAIRDRGPEITVSFKTADGLEAGKTKVKFKDLEVGKVTSIHFSEDLTGVIVKIEMQPGSESYLSEETAFWVVRPRIGAGGISGLGTLVSGAYIAMDPHVGGKPRKDFTGLELPPLTTAAGGTKFELRAEALGSFGIGTPIYYRQIEVGFVERFRLAKDNKAIVLSCYVDEEHSHLLYKNSRFWNASGVRASMTAEGIQVETESLAAVLAGGIAFDLAPGVEPGPLAENGDDFQLFPNEEESRHVFTENEHMVLYFDESVRGLVLGAPVEFRGLRLGTVKEIGAQIEPKSQSILIMVVIETQPARIDVEGMDKSGSPMERFERLIDMGLRARLEKGSLLTGALFIDFDLFPGTPVQRFGLDSRYAEMPTIRSTGAALNDALASVPDIVTNLKKSTDELAKLLASPKIDETLDSLNGVMTRAESLLADTDRDLGPLLESLRATSEEAQAVLLGADRSLDSLDAGAPQLAYRINSALEEFAAGMRSLRTLTDYLERHPEALIKGKAGE